MKAEEYIVMCVVCERFVVFLLLLLLSQEDLSVCYSAGWSGGGSLGTNSCSLYSNQRCCYIIVLPVV